MRRVTRRAGLAFDRVAEPLADALPRMDIALFAGFASAGPIGVPVAIEQVSEFEAVFGPDLPIAWDAARGTMVNAYLPPTVRAFFRNGGRRCWVLRVAGADAAANEFPLDGFVSLRRQPDGSDVVEAAVAGARSEGSWSDQLEAGALVERLPMVVNVVTLEERGLRVAIMTARQLVVGDVIRLEFRVPGLVAFGAIQTIEQAGSPSLRLDPVMYVQAGAVVGPPVTLPARPDAADRLTMTLLARSRGATTPQRLPLLGLATNHPHFWADLPTDAVFFGPLVEAPTAGQSPAQRVTTMTRFPIAGGRPGVVMTVPLDEALVESYRGPTVQPLSAVERDGMATFNASVFLDRHLLDTNTNDLMARAEFLHYQSRVDAGVDASLLGIHAGLFLDEPTLIAVPDAIHRAWTIEDEPAGALPSPASLPADPPRVEECPRDSVFRDCAPCILPAPSIDLVEAGGLLHLSWIDVASPSTVGDVFVVQESVGPTFPEWTDVWVGTRHEIDLYDRPPGTYAFRVIARRGDLVSDPSAPAFATIAPRKRATLKPIDQFDSSPMLDIHRALLRFAGARADIIAMLGMPAHYREGDALAHVQALTPDTAVVTRGIVPPLSSGEEPALSYGAIYHPWLVTSPDTTIPPDGVVCGVVAQRALERGAWIAPANQPMQAVVALTPPLAEARFLELQQGRINIVEQRPRGFVTLSEDTLSVDPDLRLLHVRRLLILLRREALRIGAQYVFEPNDEAFRRLMERTFEEMLRSLHERGAFAGRLAADGYQVVTAPSLNAPQQRDLGRFFIELRVAPAQPMTFLTIRLVQRGDRLTVDEVA